MTWPEPSVLARRTGSAVPFWHPVWGAFARSTLTCVFSFVPAPRSFSLSEREADLAIMVGRRSRADCVCASCSITRSDCMPQKTTWIEPGHPEELADLATHSLVGYVDDLIYTPELNYAREFLHDWRSSIEVSTAIGQFEAVRARRRHWHLP